MKCQNKSHMISDSYVRTHRAIAAAVAAPTKKDREAKLHYLHDSTILPKSHFRSLNRGPCGTIPILTFSPRQRLGLDIPYLFRTCRNSVYFGTYELFKFAKSGLKFFLSFFLLLLSNASLVRLLTNF